MRNDNSHSEFWVTMVTLLNSLDVNQINYTCSYMFMFFGVVHAGTCSFPWPSGHLLSGLQPQQSSPASRVVPTSELLVPRGSSGPVKMGSLSNGESPTIGLSMALIHRIAFQCKKNPSCHPLIPRIVHDILIGFSMKSTMVNHS